MALFLRAVLLLLAWLALSSGVHAAAATTPASALALAAAQTPDPPEIIWDDNPMSSYYHHGYAVAWLGDVDGDDIDDYAASTAGRSRVEVYSGDSKTSIATLNGGVRHGHSLTGLGDVNGDGVPDFAAGTPFVNGNLGEVRVYSGLDFGLLYTVGGSQAVEYFGWGLTSIGDTDHDGVPDFLVRSYLDQGTVSLHSGATGAKRFAIVPAGPAEYAGEGLAGVHDFNGDGAADFLVGAPGRGSGEVVLHSGADGAPLAFLSDSLTREYGAAVCALGDLDGDQVPDFAIGAPATTSAGGRSHAGEIFVYSGQSLSLIRFRQGTAQSQRFGALLANGGDYNGDGVADLLVGSPGADASGLQSAGKVELLSGVGLGVLGSAYGTQRYERMPSSLAGYGDAHHDRHPDYLIGNYAYGNGESGIVRMWGAPSPWLQVDNLIGGQTATLTASDCQGGSTVSFWSSRNGFGPSTTPLGLVLLSPPFRKLGSAVALPDGTAELAQSVPSALSGLRVFLQAVEVRPGLAVRLTTATGPVIQ